jgi:hypothetical protein
MKTKSGILILSKKEREALEVLIRHTKKDISFGSEASFSKVDKTGNYIFDKAEAKKAELGIEVLELVLYITK